MTIQNSPEAVITTQISTILTKVAAKNKGLHSAKHPWMPRLAMKDVDGYHVRVMNKFVSIASLSAV